MGALIDSIVGGYDGSDDGGTGDSSGSYYVQEPSGTNYTSGILQSLTSLGTGYLSKRMDIDLQTRVIGTQAYPGLRTTQNGIGGYGTVTRNPITGQQVAALNLSALMPLALVAGLVWFMARKG